MRWVEEAAMNELARLRVGLERIARRRAPLPAPQVLVRTPDWELEFGDQDQPFHTASVSKVLTATLVAMLVEAGDLGFDTPVGAVLPSYDVEGLPAAEGVTVARDVTVEHLLTHTSGLPDHFIAPRGHQTACSIGRLSSDRDRRWTLPEVLVEAGGLPPVGRPGERFCYSDTGFALLGRIVETVTGQRFETALRERILVPVGMDRTSMPHGDALVPEDVADLDVAPLWLRGHELSRALSLSAGRTDGGIVSVPGDLVRFQEALHGGQLITPEHLRHLQRPRNRFRRGIHYGAGLVTVRFGEFTPPLLRALPEPAGGLGLSAVHMFHYPEQQAHVVLNFHSTRAMSQSFRTHMRIARLVARVPARQR